MTAEEFLDKYFVEQQLPYSPEIERVYGQINAAMIEFAEYHVKEALKEAVYNAQIEELDEHMQYNPHIDKDSILNSYKNRIQ